MDKYEEGSFTYNFVKRLFFIPGICEITTSLLRWTLRTSESLPHFVRKFRCSDWATHEISKCKQHKAGWRLNFIRNWGMCDSNFKFVLSGTFRNTITVCERFVNDHDGLIAKNILRARENALLFRTAGSWRSSRGDDARHCTTWAGLSPGDVLPDFPQSILRRSAYL